MKILNKMTTLAIGGAVAASLAFSASAEELSIGAAGAATEFVAYFDQPFMAGFMMGVDKVNAGGGVNGKIKFSVQQQDTRSDPAQTMVATQGFIEDGVDVLLISSPIADALTAGPLGQAAGVLMFNMNSTNPWAPTVVGDFMFQTPIGDNLQGSVLGKFAREELGAETAWLLVSPDDPYLEIGPAYAADKFVELGGKVVGEGRYSLFQAEFGNVVAELKQIQPEPDVIFTTAIEPDFPVFMKQLRAAGINSRVINFDGIDTPTTYALGDLVNGVVLTTGVPAEQNGRYKEFVAAYKAANGADATPDTLTAYGYAAAMLLQDAVAATGSTDAAKLRDWLAATQGHDVGVNVYTYKGTDGSALMNAHVIEIQHGKPISRAVYRLTMDQIIPARQ